MTDCLAHYAAGTSPTADVERAAVTSVLNELKRVAPGKSVEVRTPPYAAVQVVEGVNHRRGTPSAVVELSASTLLRLAVGEVEWQSERASGRVSASGERSDLSHLFPLWPSRHSEPN